ncbi:Mobile element protein [Kitasatospora purpeofusca]
MGAAVATRLLITADAGGSNGYRTRARKTDLPPWPPRRAWS